MVSGLLCPTLSAPTLSTVTPAPCPLDRWITRPGSPVRHADRARLPGVEFHAAHRMRIRCAPTVGAPGQPRHHRRGHCALRRSEHRAVDGTLVKQRRPARTIGPASASRRGRVGQPERELQRGILFITEVVAQFQGAPCRKVIANISSGAAQKGYRVGRSTARPRPVSKIHPRWRRNSSEAAPFIAVNINPGVMAPRCRP